MPNSIAVVNLAREIQNLYGQINREEQQINRARTQNSESSSDGEERAVIDQIFNARIEPYVRNRFQSYGDNDENRINAIFSEIKRLILDEIISDISTNAVIRDWLRDNREILLNPAHPQHAARMRESRETRVVLSNGRVINGYLAERRSVIQAAWRNFDVDAPWVNWPPLFVGLRRDNTIRHRLAHYYLIAIDDTQSPDTLAWRRANFIGKLADIRRGHNEAVRGNLDGVDDPSCATGTYGRMGAMGAQHPIGQLPVNVAEQLPYFFKSMVQPNLTAAFARCNNLRDKINLRDSFLHLHCGNVVEIINSTADYPEVLFAIRQDFVNSLGTADNMIGEMDRIFTSQPGGRALNAHERARVRLMLKDPLYVQTEVLDSFRGALTEEERSQLEPQAAQTPTLVDEFDEGVEAEKQRAEIAKAEMLNDLRLERQYRAEFSRDAIKQRVIQALIATGRDAREVNEAVTRREEEQLVEEYTGRFTSTKRALQSQLNALRGESVAIQQRRAGLQERLREENLHPNTIRSIVTNSDELALTIVIEEARLRQIIRADLVGANALLAGDALEQAIQERLAEEATQQRLEEVIQPLRDVEIRAYTERLTVAQDGCILREYGRAFQAIYSSINNQTEVEQRNRVINQMIIMKEETRLIQGGERYSEREVADFRVQLRQKIEGAVQRRQVRRIDPISGANLNDLLSAFIDPITLDIMVDPVYFPNHPSGQRVKFFERDAATQLFNNVRTTFADIARLQRSMASNTLRQDVQNHASFRVLLGERATQLLSSRDGDHTVDSILRGERLQEILQSGGMDLDTFNPLGREQRINYVLNAIAGQALAIMRHEVEGLTPGQARCPSTRRTIVEANMQPANLFRRIALVAARAAVQAHPNTLGNNSEELIQGLDVALEGYVATQEVENALDLLYRNQGERVFREASLRATLQTWGIRCRIEGPNFAVPPSAPVAPRAPVRNVPLGYDQAINENQVLNAGIGTALNYSQPGRLHQLFVNRAGTADHHRLTSGGIGIAGPYQSIISLPRVPVIHPYNPLGNTNANARRDTGIPRFSLTARLPQGTLGNLSPGAAEYLAQNNINLQNVETFVSFQNRPWQNEVLEFRPHPWLHQNAPEQGVYNRTSLLRVAFADLDSRLGPLVETHATTHGEGGDPQVVFSPNNMQILGLGNHGTTEGFYSFCINRDTGHAAITFHCLLNDADQARLEQIVRQGNVGGVALDAVHAAMIGDLPDAITTGLNQFMRGRDPRAFVRPMPHYYMAAEDRRFAEERRLSESGRQFAEGQDIPALQRWLTNNPAPSPFHTSVEQVYLSESGRQFAETQDIAALQRWLTENPGASPFRTSVEQVCQRRLGESGRQFAETQDIAALQRWLAENPSASPFRTSVEQVYQQALRLSESGRQFAETQDATSLQIWLTNNPTPSSFHTSVEQVYQRRLSELGRQFAATQDTTALQGWLAENPSVSPFRASVEQAYQSGCGRQFAEGQDIPALQRWLTNNPAPSPFHTSVEQVYLSGCGRQFAETQDIAALQRWLTENPGVSSFRTSVEQVYQRRLGESGRQFAEGQDIPALQRWLTENPGASPFRTSVEEVCNRRLVETRRDNRPFGRIGNTGTVT